MIMRQLAAGVSAFLCAVVLLSLVPGIRGSDLSHIRVRAVYGGAPYFQEEAGRGFEDLGLNAVFLHSGSINSEIVHYVKGRGARIFAEFNTLHVASYLEEHPDAAPIGPDGEVSPAPSGWQGICPTHPGYRRYRMREFRQLLSEYPLDGIWMDYHHAHASWEQSAPDLPDTCFCDRCIETFETATGLSLPVGPTSAKTSVLLGELHDRWVNWRNSVFTDWVREFREVLDEVRPGALLGSFHNPWSDTDFDGARLAKLNIDLKAQAAYIDVFSPMPYHARFGHANDPGWISRQVSWLGSYLGIRGVPDEDKKIWPIVQLSDWGEPVSARQVTEVLEEGTRTPSTGVIVFAWGSLRKQTDKVEKLWDFFRAIR